MEAAVPGGLEGVWQPPSRKELPTSGAGQSEQLYPPSKLWQVVCTSPLPAW